MAKKQQLVEEAQALVKSARAILDKYPTDKEIPAEDRTTADKMLDDAAAKKAEADGMHDDEGRRSRADTLTKELITGKAQSEESEERERALADDDDDDAETADQKREKRAKRKIEKRAFNHFIRGGVRAMEPLEIRTLTEGSDSAGGFMVPEDFRMELIKKMMGYTVIRNRATQFNTSRDSVVIPRLADATNSDMYTSAVRITWAGETYTDDEGLTEPTFEQVRMAIDKAIAKTRVSRDLLMDSAISVEDMLSTLYAEAYAIGEDDAFINGNGIGKPLGILNDAAVPTTTLGATLLADDLITLVYATPVQYRNRGAFVVSSATEAFIRKMKDNSGGAGVGNYIWQMGLQAGAPSMILGYPVSNSEFVPATTTGAKSIIFGDLSAFWIFDRLDMELQRLDERYAEQGLVGWVATKRLGAMVAQPWALRIGVQA